VQGAVSEIEGVADLSVEHQVDVDAIRFVLDRGALARYGLRIDDVTRTIETAFAGTTVGRVFESGTSFDLVVKLSQGPDPDFERIAMLPIDTPDGTTVPVNTVARVVREESPNMVLRENVQRRIVVSCNVAGRDLGGVIDDIRREVASQVSLPSGYRVEYGGQFESQQSASRRLVLLGAVALAGLFTLLMLAFGRTRDALIVMVNLPLALIGGVAGVYVAGGVLSVASIIGFITLFGIATRNGIMLVSHVQYLLERESVSDFRTAVIRGAQERLIPILMTALAAGLALIPLALSGGRAGSEIQTPMAIVILCGLTTSTILNMAVVPTLYLRYGKPRVRSEEVHA
jgi:Cu/Ag efflux pump CusA